MIKKILLVVNVPEFFLSHRLPIAIAARNAGYDVHVATGPGETCQQIKELGFAHHLIPLSRSGRNPTAELRTLWVLLRIIHSIKPDLIHLVTIKPVLYGGLVSRIARVPAVVAAISGLGSVFVARERRGFGLRSGIELLYRVALGQKNIKVIFQNPSDRAILASIGAVSDDKTVLIKGSGVDLARYAVRPEPDNVPVITFAARLLKDKGVEEFVEAARILKARGLQAVFRLIGSTDPDNPTTVTQKQLDQWQSQGIVEVLGYRTDIADLFAQTNLVVLPSYYGEGLPKVLIEAAACGRAVITTDHPGCSDAIEPGKTGLLVPVRDAIALADAIQSLINDPVRRKEMGVAGRAFAEREFAIEKVVNTHLDIYRELLSAEPER